MKKAIVVGQKERVGAWLAPRIHRNAPWAAYEAIGIERDGELVGGCVIEGYVKGARCSMHIAGEGKHWLTREFLSVCFDYVFRQLGCRVALGMVSSSNTAALAFDRHLGFQDVCTIRDGAGAGGDLVILEMRPEFCRWLKEGVK